MNVVRSVGNWMFGNNGDNNGMWLDKKQPNQQPDQQPDQQPVIQQDQNLNNQQPIVQQPVIQQDQNLNNQQPVIQQDNNNDKKQDNKDKKQDNKLWINKGLEIPTKQILTVKECLDIGNFLKTKLDEIEGTGLYKFTYNSYNIYKYNLDKLYKKLIKKNIYTSSQIDFSEYNTDNEPFKEDIPISEWISNNEKNKNNENDKIYPSTLYSYIDDMIDNWYNDNINNMTVRFDEMIDFIKIQINNINEKISEIYPHDEKYKYIFIKIIEMYIITRLSDYYDIIVKTVIENMLKNTKMNNNFVGFFKSTVNTIITILNNFTLNDEYFIHFMSIDRYIDYITMVINYMETEYKEEFDKYQQNNLESLNNIINNYYNNVLDIYNNYINNIFTKIIYDDLYIISNEDIDKHLNSYVQNEDKLSIIETLFYLIFVSKIINKNIILTFYDEDGYKKSGFNPLYFNDLSKLLFDNLFSIIMSIYANNYYDYIVNTNKLTQINYIKKFMDVLLYNFEHGIKTSESYDEGLLSRDMLDNIVKRINNYYYEYNNKYESIVKLKIDNESQKIKGYKICSQLDDIQSNITYDNNKYFNNDYYIIKDIIDDIIDNIRRFINISEKDVFIKNIDIIISEINKLVDTKNNNYKNSVIETINKRISLIDSLSISLLYNEIDNDISNKCDKILNKFNRNDYLPSIDDFNHLFDDSINKWIGLFIDIYKDKERSKYMAFLGDNYINFTKIINKILDKNKNFNLIYKYLRNNTTVYNNIYINPKVICLEFIMDKIRQELYMFIDIYTEALIDILDYFSETYKNDFTNKQKSDFYNIMIKLMLVYIISIPIDHDYINNRLKYIESNYDITIDYDYINSLYSPYNNESIYKDLYYQSIYDNLSMFDNYVLYNFNYKQLKELLNKYDVLYNYLDNDYIYDSIFRLAFINYIKKRINKVSGGGKDIKPLNEQNLKTTLQFLLDNHILNYKDINKIINLYDEAKTN